MPVYQKANKETLAVVSKTMGQFYGGLRDADVQVQTLMAYPNRDDNGDPTGPAIVVNGSPAVACIKILNLKQRVARGFDVELTLDGDQWTEKSDEERTAIADHELRHLAFCPDWSR